MLDRDLSLHILRDTEKFRDVSQSDAYLPDFSQDRASSEMRNDTGEAAFERINTDLAT
jgi:hypothetical protein